MDALESGMSSLNINRLTSATVSESYRAWALIFNRLKIPIDVIRIILDRFIVGVNGMLIERTDNLLSIFPRIDTDVPRVVSGDQLSNAWGGIIPRGVTDRLYFPRRTTRYGRNSWKYYLRYVQRNITPSGYLRVDYNRLRRSTEKSYIDLT